MTSWEQMAKELEDFVLDEDIPTTKAEKKAAREERQRKRSEELMRLSKLGPNVPKKELRRRQSIRFIR